MCYKTSALRRVFGLVFRQIPLARRIQAQQLDHGPLPKKRALKSTSLAARLWRFSSDYPAS